MATSSPRGCRSCHQRAEEHRCANDTGATQTHRRLAWHDHAYDEWYCQPCADGYGEEFFDDADMHPVTELADEPAVVP